MGAATAWTANDGAGEGMAADEALLAFMHAVSRTLKLSENDCRDLLEQLSPTLPQPMAPILGEDCNPRTHVSY